MATYYIKNTSGSIITIQDLGIVLPDNTSIPLDSNAISGWLTDDLASEINASRITVSVTNIGDSSGDLTPSEGIRALSLVNRYDRDNATGVTFSQAVTADSNTDITASEAETLTNGSDASLLHNHDNRYYTESELSTANSGSVAVHWDNIINAPNFGSLEWQAPVICLAEITSPAPPDPASAGDYYMDTDDNHLYKYDGSSWVDQGTPVVGDRFIVNDDDNIDTNDLIYEWDGTQWVSLSPQNGWSVMVSDAGDGKAAQYIYDDMGSSPNWVKIADVDWGNHSSIGGRDAANSHPANAISFNNSTSGLDATNVQAALDELSTEQGVDLNNIVFVAKNGNDSATGVIKGTIANPYGTVQEAIDSVPTSGGNAAAVDNRYTIFIMPGTYNEEVDLSKDWVSLSGVNKKSTVITSEGNTLTISNIENQSVEVSNLRIETTASDLTQAALSLLGDGEKIFNVEINSPSGARGVYSNSAFHHHLNNVSIRDAKLRVDAGNVMFLNSNVTGSNVDVTGGFLITEGSTFSFSNGNVIEQSGGSVRIDGCRIVSAGSYKDYNQTSGTVYWGWVDHDNSKTTFNGTITYIYTSRDLYYDSSLTGLSSTNVQEALDELSAQVDDSFDGIIYVAKNGSDTPPSPIVDLGTFTNPFLTVQAAINEAQARGGYQIVFVGPGLYEENITVPAHVALYSHGKEPTRIGTNNASNTHTFEFGNGGRVFVKNINLRGDSVVVNHDVGASAGVSLWLDNSNFGPLTFNGRGSDDYLQILESCWSFGDVTVHAANVDVRDSILSASFSVDDVGGETTSANGKYGVISVKGSEVFQDVSFSGEISVSFGHTFSYGNFTVDGAACEYNYDVVSGNQNLVVQNGAQVTKTSKAIDLSYNNTIVNLLSSKDVQGAIDEIAENYRVNIQNIIFVSQNGDDTALTNGMRGSIAAPYRTIQAAINAVEIADDNTVDNQYLIWIAPGRYEESLVFNDNRLRHVTVVGHGTVIVDPPSGDAIDSTTLNDGLQSLTFNGISFRKNVVIEGESNNGNAFSTGLFFKNCTFNTPFNIKNIVNFEFYRCNIKSSGVLQNIISASFDECVDTTATLEIDYNSTLLKPATISETRVVVQNMTTLMTHTVSQGAVLDILEGAGSGGSITVNGDVNAYASYLQGSIIINPTGTFTSYGSFFDPSLIVDNGGAFVNNTLSKVVYYDNSITTIPADNVQDAIDNLKQRIDEFKIPSGTTFPPSPDGGDLFYRTDLRITYQYDNSRSKWLSTTEMFLDWGANNADGKYLNIHGASATQTGYLMPRDGTIVGFTARGASGNMSKSFEIRKNNDHVNPLFSDSLVSGEFNSTDPATMNIDFTAGDYIQVFMSSTGSPVRDVVAMAIVAWR